MLFSFLMWLPLDSLLYVVEKSTGFCAFMVNILFAYYFVKHVILNVEMEDSDA